MRPGGAICFVTWRKGDGPDSRGALNAIVEEVDPERIILFGSRARGDGDERSDLDLLIIVSEPFGPGRTRRQALSRLRRALMSHLVPIDLLVFSSDEVDRLSKSRNHVVSMALREGRERYARP